MEEITKKTKFPIGAIFLILCGIYTGIYVIKSLVSTFGPDYLIDIFYFVTYVSFICFAFAFGAILLMRKQGLPQLVALAIGLIYAIIEVIYILVSNLDYTSYYSWPTYVYWFSLLLNIIALACLAVKAFLDMSKKEMTDSFNRVFKIVFLAITAIALLISVLFYFRYITNVFDVSGFSLKLFFKYPGSWEATMLRVGLLNIFYYVIYYVGIALCGLWMFDPYAKSAKGERGEGDAAARPTDEHFISMGKHVCLLFLTCGIWQMIWIYKTVIFTNRAEGEEPRNPMTALLLYLFIPFYAIYWTYKTALRIDKIAKDASVISDLGTVCLLLSIFLPILPPILMQDKINKIVTDGKDAQDDRDKSGETQV